MLTREGRVQSPLAHAFQKHFIASLSAMTEHSSLVSMLNA